MGFKPYFRIGRDVLGRIHEDVQSCGGHAVLNGTNEMKCTLPPLPEKPQHLSHCPHAGEDVQHHCIELAASQSQTSQSAALFLGTWLSPPLVHSLSVSVNRLAEVELVFFSERYRNKTVSLR